MDNTELRRLKGGNFDLDLCSGDSIGWKQDSCPWNELDGTKTHRCATKNTSICKYFYGLGVPDGIDTVLCSFPPEKKIAPFSS